MTTIQPHELGVNPTADTFGTLPSALPSAQQVPWGAVPQSVTTTLQERGARYGKFPDHANITWALKGAMQATPKWARLAADQKEALDMIAHKIGRILNGDPDYADSWHDIAGYAELVCNRLNGNPV